MHAPVWTTLAEVRTRTGRVVRARKAKASYAYDDEDFSDFSEGQGSESDSEEEDDSDGASGPALQPPTLLAYPYISFHKPYKSTGYP